MKDGVRRRGTISATEAAKSFGRVIDRVREERATYVVERSGVPVARISPVETAAATMRDFKAMLRDRGRPGEEYLRAVEAAVDRHNKPRVRRNPWAR